MGMMGRRSIYNGGVPTAIMWHNIEDIIYNITEEYKNRGNAKIKDTSKTIKKYINTGDNWLNI